MAVLRPVRFLMSEVKGYLAHKGGPRWGCGFLWARYRGTSLISDSTPLGLCSRTMPRALLWPQVVARFLMGEVPLCPLQKGALSLLFPRLLPLGIQPRVG